MATSQPIRARLVTNPARWGRGVAASAGTGGRDCGRARTRMWLAGALVVCVSAFGLSACVSGDVPAAPSDDAELVEGRALYSANCVSCHGTDGGGGIGSKLNGGRLIERYPDLAEQLMIVTEGRRAMPSFSDKLSPSELEAVVRYTREVIAEQ